MQTSEFHKPHAGCVAYVLEMKKSDLIQWLDCLTEVVVMQAAKNLQAVEGFEPTCEYLRVALHDQHGLCTKFFEL